MRGRATRWPARWARRYGVVVVAVVVAVSAEVWPGARGGVSALTTRPTWTTTDPGLPSDPLQRAGMAAVYDPQLGGVLVVGGSQLYSSCVGIPVGGYAGPTVDSTACSVDLTVGSLTCNPTDGGCQDGPFYPSCSPFDAGSPVTDGTWLWRSGKWKVLAAAGSPGPLQEAAAVYDARHNQVVLLGLPSANQGLQTWTFDGSVWTLRHPAATPPTRVGFSHALTFDWTTQAVVLFGGAVTGVDPAPIPLGDMWSWDGSSWSQLHPVTSPPPRGGATMAYSPALGRTVLTGGIVGTVPIGVQGPPCVFSRETWIWDGSTWARANVSGPSPRIGAAMAYDPDLHGLVLFGGQSVSGAPMGDTSIFDGAWHSPWKSAWRDVELVGSPPARWDAGLVAVPEVHGVVLFGGANAADSSLNDTWKLSMFTVR